MKKSKLIGIDTELKKEFNRFMKLHQLKNLKQVRSLPTAKLLSMEGFGYRQLIDVVLNKEVQQL